MAPDYITPKGATRTAFHAMGTTVTLLLPADEADRGTAAVRQLFAIWEATLSRFRADSELSWVNTQAGETVLVSALFAQVLDMALAAARATDGIFDPTMLHQIEALGYDRSFELLADAEVRDDVTNPCGHARSVEFNPVFQTVRLPPGVALDFGGIAKGMAVDAALDQMIADGISWALIEAGGDIRVHGTPPGRGGWNVAIEHAESNMVVSVPEGALATSSVLRRRWGAKDAQLHHLLDPRTGMPAQTDVLAATVAAPRCAQAEVAAKVALILGSQRGASFLDGLQFDGLFILSGGDTRRAGPWATSDRSAA